MRCCDLCVIDSTSSTVTVEASGPFGQSDMVLPLTLEAFEAGMAKWDAGECVQDCFKLNAVQREFLMTGMDSSTQKKIFR
jgi:hypothetical protein